MVTQARKITADMHLHSLTSPDALEDIETMCGACLEAGLDTACFCEHDDAYTQKFRLNVDLHIQAVARARAAYPSLQVLRGIEAGYSAGSLDKLRRDIHRLEPDFVLLSVHEVEGIDPFFADRYYAGRTWLEGQRAYLKIILESMDALEDWDSLAHLGYSARYAPAGRTPRPLRLADAPDLIETVLHNIVAKGRALEVNTSSTTAGGDTIPGMDILARYRELGGERITLGSDAHRANHVAAGFEATVASLRQLGFNQHAVFCGRRMQTRSL